MDAHRFLEIAEDLDNIDFITIAIEGNVFEYCPRRDVRRIADAIRMFVHDQTDGDTKSSDTKSSDTKSGDAKFAEEHEVLFAVLGATNEVVEQLLLRLKEVLTKEGKS